MCWFKASRSWHVCAVTAPSASAASLGVAATAAADVHLGYVLLRDILGFWKGSQAQECVCHCEGGGQKGECRSLERLLEKQLDAAKPVTISFTVQVCFSTLVLILGFIAGWWCARRTITVGRVVPRRLPDAALESETEAETADTPTRPQAGRGRGRGIIIRA